MDNLILRDVNLFGDTVTAAQDKDGNIWAGVKWVCEGLGFTEGQRQRLTTNIGKDLVLNKGVANLQLPTKGGSQEVLCLKHDFVPLWLAKISITPSMKENNPELVDKLIQYQLKAKDVLAEAFLPKKESQQDKDVAFKELVECVGLVGDMLHMNDASKILMLEGLYKTYDLPTAYLPKYEHNGSREMKSATELLKRFNLRMSVKSFNILMCEHGFLEERERKSSSSPSGVKKYKALTEKGLKYGENAVSPHNQREVQPLYYADSFEELFNLIVREVA